ncbi:MAG: uroporphyrinogen decarboxylase [Gammaproteobacteria bacterium]
MAIDTRPGIPRAAVKNDRLIRALLRKPLDATPIWLMRQAGRYLPEYRETRRRAGDFMTLCKTPDLACEVTLQPIERFPLDAAILFSDILTIPDAMGLGLSVQEGVGPRFERPVRSAAEIRALGVPDPEDRLRYVMDAVRQSRRALAGRVPLIGFAGSPWTLATYMVEGGSGREFRRVKGLMFEAPRLLHELLYKLARAVTAYLKAQAEAGAQVLMVFDTWGGVLSAHAYDEFSLRYLAEVVTGVKAAPAPPPVILFTKGGGGWIESIAATGCEAVGLDWTQDLGATRRRVGHQVALQGNLDPLALYAPPERIRAEVSALLSSFGAGSGHVFNLGHGIEPDTDPEHVRVLVDAVHELSVPYQAGVEPSGVEPSGVE